MPSEPSQHSESDAKFWARTVSYLLSSLNGILDKVGALFPWVRDWLNRPVIVPGRNQNWWHMGKTGAQQPAMQIVSYWYVTNRTNKPAHILNAYIKKPWTQGDVFVKDVHSSFHGSYPVPSHTTTELHADFWISPPVRREGRGFHATIVFVDQNGQKRTIRDVEFASDKRKSPPVEKLSEESVYQIESDVEKKVAAVLKEEISRYKQNSRKSGGLGSVSASYGGRTIKQIYQDGWTSSNSGQRQDIVADPGNSRIHSENGDALVAFYNSLATDSDKALFVNSLLARLNRNKEYYCVSYLIIYLLFRLGELSTALATAKVSLREQPTFWDNFFRRKRQSRLVESHQRHGFGDFLGLINGLLRFEHSAFTDNDFDQIEKFIATGDEFGIRIIEKLNSARAFRVGTC